MTLLLSATPKYLLRVHSTRVGFASARKEVRQGRSGAGERRPGGEETDASEGFPTHRRQNRLGGSSLDWWLRVLSVHQNRSCCFHSCSFINNRIYDARYLATSKLS